MAEDDGDRVLWRGEPDKHFFIERSDWLVAVAGLTWIAPNSLLILDYFDGRSITLLPALRIEWRIIALVVGTVLTIGHPLVRGLSLLYTKYTSSGRTGCGSPSPRGTR
ncbi:hypothetical protein [Catellatospora sichuanensis]|uniref:hypothetical protein n=1 Tax=Catellatospora sichuanensis TaxID=1969805 RepID=UPI00118465A3|nr:hypothetical protein [Catellatospora sichuanensis]